MIDSAFLAIPQREVHAELLEDEQDDGRIGITAWLISGLKIQEAQYACILLFMIFNTIYIHSCRTELVAFIRKQGKVPTAKQRMDIVKKRTDLQNEITEFHETAGTLFPALDVYEQNLQQVPYGDDVISDAEDDDPDTVPVIPRGNVEKLELILPSTHPGTMPRDLRSAAKIEIKLRKAQAEEALEGIRHEICHKSYIFRANIKLMYSKKNKQRGYAALHVADRALRHHIRIYKQARWSLQRLHAPPDVLVRYKELNEEDLKPLKAVYDPNSRGSSSASPPWIWSIHVAEGADNFEYLNERKPSPPTPNLCIHVYHSFSLSHQLVTSSGKENKVGGRN